MARIRSIKPEFFTSATMCALPLEAQRTFIGMWCHADDVGRIEDDPTLLRAVLWARYDRSTDDVKADVRALLEAGLLERSEMVERRSGKIKTVLQITGWSEHQAPPKPSPPLFIPLTGEQADEVAVKPGRMDYSDEFDRFWSVYPRRQEKRAAYRAWQAARKVASAEQIIAGAARHAADPNRDPQFTKHPATWLNKGCWDDAPEPPKGRRASRSAAKVDEVQGVIARAAARDAERERKGIEG